MCLDTRPTVFDCGLNKTFLFALCYNIDYDVHQIVKDALPSERNGGSTVTEKKL